MFLKIKKSLIAIYEWLYEYKMHFEDYRRRCRLGVPQIMSKTATIDYIINNHCSIARLGDGELKMICGGEIGFQKYDSTLAQRLKAIVSHPQNPGNCLIGLTDIFGNLKNSTPEAYEYTWRLVFKYRQEWMKFISLDYLYGHTEISRLYMGSKDKSHCAAKFQKIRQLWEKRDIVFIEGEKSRLGVGNDLFSNARSCKRLLCPAKNAFAYYPEILKECLKLDKSALLIIALGPTATVLAYDLAQDGYQALDIGHIDIEYEWFLMKAEQKVPVPNKYTNESWGNNDLIGNLNDDEYNQSIIARINSVPKL